MSDTDIVYRVVDDRQLHLDVLRPGRPNGAAIVYLHGGGWRNGSKNSGRNLLDPLVEHGYTCFAVNYRLVTPEENKHPSQVHDVQHAVRWVRANAERYGIDSSKVAALGTSAGGHLAGMLGVTDTWTYPGIELEAHSSRVNAVIALCGSFDLTVEHPNESIQQNVVNFIGEPPEVAPEKYRAASPAHHADRKSAPFLLFHSHVDSAVPFDQSQRMHDALVQAGSESKLIGFDNCGHGLDIEENVPRIIAESVAFLERQFNSIN